MSAIHLAHSSSCSFAHSASRHIRGAGRLGSGQQGGSRLRCSTQAKLREKDAESSALSLQSLWARLATDAAVLANIVPLGRQRQDSKQDAAVRELQLRDDQTAAGASPPAQDDTDDLETRLEEELESQGQQSRVHQALRHWHSKHRPSHQPPSADQELHPALHVLQERLRCGSKPGARQDSYKLGLAVEGGGMRGSVTAGALRALHDLGVRDVFDAVYGSSAGAMNLTYYLSQQREGASIYHEDISNETFCNMRRLLNRQEGPALDLSFLLNEVMQNIKPLDWDAVIHSPIPLKVVASCLDTLQPIILEDFESAEDLRQCLRASAQVPAVAGDPIEHRGRRLVDAAVFEPVPFRAAISDGCTHVITLCSRPPMNGGWLAQMKEDLLANVVKHAVLSPSYMKAAWARELDNLRAFGLTTDQMMMASLDPASNELDFLAGSYNYPIIPGPASRFSPVTINPALLQAGIESGEQAVIKLLGQEVVPGIDSREDSPFFAAGLVANGMEPHFPAFTSSQPLPPHLQSHASRPPLGVAGF